VNIGLRGVLDTAFGHPRGVLGRLGGRLMARFNVDQEDWAVQQAELKTGDEVLVIGPGPGVGLDLAAWAVEPTGHVVAVDPSQTMREMAVTRCAGHVASGLVEIRDGRAEHTRCAEDSVDVAISVNNVMLWNKPVGFAELARVIRPGGRLVLTVHRHVLDVPPDDLRAEAEAAGFTDVRLTVRPRHRNSPAVELLATAP
jgi:ubiquinone/menaquinone biosynthesis C-methylase UbiE